MNAHPQQTENHAGATPKQCPRCERNLTTSDFGVCRARKDGLNLYCKRCIREKTTAQRVAMCEWRAKQAAKLKERREQAQPEKRPQPAPRLARSPMPLTMAPADRVVASLQQYGPLRFRELRSCARVSDDELSDLLPSLMLWEADPTKKVHSKNGTGPRVYFLEGCGAAKASLPKIEEPHSYGISTIYGEGERG
jgi:hypothetical protein